MVQYFTNIYESVKSSLVGMSVTFGHLFTKSVTLQYPKEKMEMPELARLKLDYDWEDCTGCNKCVRACPVDCIIIETVKATKGDDVGKTKNDTQKKLWVTKYVIDYSECMYCGLCTYPCPEECIYMTPEYEYSEYDRGNLIVSFSKLSAGEIVEKERLLEKEKAEKEALRAAKAAEKAKAKMETKATVSETDESLLIQDYVAKALAGDEEIVKNIEDRVLRSKVKKALFKAKRMGAAAEVPKSAEVSQAEASTSDYAKIMRLVEKGLAGEMDAINAIEDRVFRSKVKKALMKAKRERGQK